MFPFINDSQCMHHIIPIIIPKQDRMEYYFLSTIRTQQPRQHGPFTTTQSIDCKPSDLRYSTKKSIKRTRKQAFNTWPDTAELVAGWLILFVSAISFLLLQWLSSVPYEATGDHGFTRSLFARNGVNKCFWHGSRRKEDGIFVAPPGQWFPESLLGSLPQIHRIKADWQRTSSAKKFDWAALRPSVSNLDSVGLSLSSKIYTQKKWPSLSNYTASTNPVRGEK